MHKILSLSLASLLLLAGCESPQIYPPTPKPDLTIHVVPTPNGMTAVPPTCPSWASATIDPYDNQPLPQFGCATARNLAMMVERPEDLVHGRDSGNSSGVMAVGSMRRYYNNQTRGLIYPSSAPDTAVDATTAPSAASPMTGDATGSAAASSSSSSSAPAAP